MHVLNACCVLDLQLIKILYDFKKIDAFVTESALNKLELHLLHLTNKKKPLVFFDASVPHHKKTITLQQ